MGVVLALRYIRLFPYFPKDGFTLSWKMPLAQIADVKKFPLNYDISLNMKKTEKEERRSFLILGNKLIQSDEYGIVFGL